MCEPSSSDDNGDAVRKCCDGRGGFGALLMKLVVQAVQLSDCPSSRKGEGAGDKEPCVVRERLKVGEAFFVERGVLA
jgi:hypothetical protein